MARNRRVNVPDVLRLFDKRGVSSLGYCSTRDSRRTASAYDTPVPACVSLFATGFVKFVALNDR